MLFLTFESFKCTFHLIDLLKITIYPNSFLIIIYIYIQYSKEHLFETATI